MQCHGQLHRAQIAGEMAAGLADALQQEGAQFGGQLRQLVFAQTAQILRIVDGIEKRRGSHGVAVPY